MTHLELSSLGFSPTHLSPDCTIHSIRLRVIPHIKGYAGVTLRLPLAIQKRLDSQRAAFGSPSTDT